MDITDCEGDANAGIATLPVKYGKKFASRVALVCSSISAASACGASLVPWIGTLLQGGASPQSFFASFSVSSLLGLVTTNSQARKVLLAVAGSGTLLLRTFSVWKTDGEDADLAERAIRESLLSVLLVLASFV